MSEAQDEEDRVEDVGLARTVEPGDRVELGVQVTDRGSGGVAFEALDDDLLDVH